MGGGLGGGCGECTPRAGVPRDTRQALRTQARGPGECGVHERRLFTAHPRYAAPCVTGASKAASREVGTWLLHLAGAALYRGRTLHATYTNRTKIGRRGRGECKSNQQHIQQENTDEPPQPHPERGSLTPALLDTMQWGARDRSRLKRGTCAPQKKTDRGGGGEGRPRQGEGRGEEWEGEVGHTGQKKKGRELTQRRQTSRRGGVAVGAGECGAGMNRGARGVRSTQGLTAAAGHVGHSVSARPARGRPRRQKKDAAQGDGSNRERDHGRKSTCRAGAEKADWRGSGLFKPRGGGGGAAERRFVSQIERGPHTGSNPLNAGWCAAHSPYVGGGHRARTKGACTSWRH